MADDELRAALATFTKDKEFQGKGPLCVALVTTQHTKNRGLPLDADSLVTARGGQVLGLGKSAVQSVLSRHGITRVLAAEGGRTSRGSLGKMREYVAFLNALGEGIDLDAVEAFWIERVKEFFAADPFRIRPDTSQGLRAIMRDVIEQAIERQRESGGISYVGAMLQHLVGAKLDCVLGPGRFEHHSFSTADAPSGRVGDFFIGDTAIHVTAAPGEDVIRRCRKNLDAGHQPVLVTMERRVAVAQSLAEDASIAERLDIFGVEQFVSLNLYEFAKFDTSGRGTAIVDLVTRYNEIIETVETDPSMKISLK